ncbi:EF-hand domain-containing protein [Acidisphaera rubrifaciens]|uniref:EF-hand domain-containing protein n=1 Tax=Acidisphaera rubrifaciens HS-AP3 TaxID=1231350 RepID=A0A0D6PA67_9PROT|nr:hypothetical protein [Acidisphaera rubrifaciens]GAN78246.1 hypothetical protein Asru_0705_06 [Acidisphaera rubrifaciens HS-AP3]
MRPIFLPGLLCLAGATMLGASVLGGVPFGAHAARAQAAPAASAQPGAHRQTVAQRFAEANTTHDGHLTLAQAQAGFPAMAYLFDRIDRDRKGYITMADIHAYYEAKRAARRAASD